PGAERNPDHDAIAKVEGVHQVEIEIGEIIDRGDTGRPFGMAETWMGRGDQPSAFGQDRENGRRWIEADVGVQEQNRPAVSAVDQLDARPVDDEGGCRRLRGGVHASFPDISTRPRCYFLLAYRYRRDRNLAISGFRPTLPSIC